jgi:hypothetical protein
VNPSTSRCKSLASSCLKIVSIDRRVSFKLKLVPVVRRNGVDFCATCEAKHLKAYALNIMHMSKKTYHSPSGSA